jgi:hypothetical protein
MAQTVNGLVIDPATGQPISTTDGQTYVDTPASSSQSLTDLEKARATANGQNYRAPGFIGNFDRTQLGSIAPVSAVQAPQPTTPLASVGTGNNSGQSSTDTNASNTDQAGRGTIDPSSIGLDGVSAKGVGTALGSVTGVPGLGMVGNAIGSAIDDAKGLQNQGINSIDLGTLAAKSALSPVNGLLGMVGIDPIGPTADDLGIDSSLKGINSHGIDAEVDATNSKAGPGVATGVNGPRAASNSETEEEAAAKNSAEAANEAAANSQGHSTSGPPASHDDHNDDPGPSPTDSNGGSQTDPGPGGVDPSGGLGGGPGSGKGDNDGPGGGLGGGGGGGTEGSGGGGGAGGNDASDGPGGNGGTWALGGVIPGRRLVGPQRVSSPRRMAQGGYIDPNTPGLSPSAAQALRGAHLQAAHPNESLPDIAYRINGGRAAVEQNAPRAANYFRSWQADLNRAAAQPQDSAPRPSADEVGQMISNHLAANPLPAQSMAATPEEAADWQQEERRQMQAIPPTLQQYAEGGAIPTVAEDRRAGGPVTGPGTWNSDNVNTKTSPGEFVVPGNVTAFYGQKFFDDLIKNVEVKTGQKRGSDQNGNPPSPEAEESFERTQGEESPAHEAMESPEEEAAEHMAGGGDMSQQPEASNPPHHQGVPLRAAGPTMAAPMALGGKILEQMPDEEIAAHARALRMKGDVRGHQAALQYLGRRVRGQAPRAMAMGGEVPSPDTGTTQSTVGRRPTAGFYNSGNRVGPQRVATPRFGGGAAAGGGIRVPAVRQIGGAAPQPRPVINAPGPKPQGMPNPPAVVGSGPAESVAPIAMPKIAAPRVARVATPRTGLGMVGRGR